jgi:hypothetical protein
LFADHMFHGIAQGIGKRAMGDQNQADHNG